MFVYKIISFVLGFVNGCSYLIKENFIKDELFPGRFSVIMFINRPSIKDI